MITLFGGAKYFKFVSFLLYVMEVKRLKCAMLGAYTVNLVVFCHFVVYLFFERHFLLLLSS